MWKRTTNQNGKRERTGKGDTTLLLRAKMNIGREEDGLHIDDLPDHLLVEVASFLGKECRALWAVSMSAPSAHWTATSAVSAKGRRILTLQRESWREEWREVDFGKFQPSTFRRKENGIIIIQSRRFSDDDLKAVLLCIDAATTVGSLFLTSGCEKLTGGGLEPLRGSTVLRRVDLSSGHKCSLDLEVVLPVLDSIVSSNDNKLRHIQFPKKWRDAKHESLSRFISRYNDMLETRVQNCCQCDASACKSDLDFATYFMCPPFHAFFLAAPGIHEDGDRYGVQTATCYKCLKIFCYDNDGTCQDGWENSYEFCPCCEKYFCNRCCVVFVCEACDKDISCEHCMEGTWCNVDGCGEGPFCLGCAEEQTTWLSCCEVVACMDCCANCDDCPYNGGYG